MRLSQMQIFSGTNESDCQRMIDCFKGEQRRYIAGETICQYGNSTKIGIVQSGSVILVRIDISGNQSILDRIDEGGIFGETVAFSFPGSESIFAISEKDSEVIFIDYYHFAKRCSNACNCHSVVVENLLRLVADKAYQLSEKIEILSHRSIREKLMCYFRIECSKNSSDNFVMPFSMTTLADSICVDRSAMMREIKKMKDEKLISIENKKVTVLDSAV